MDPVLKEMYSLVAPSLPYVFAAYGILWVAFVVYVSLIFRRLMKVETEMAVVERALERRGGQA
jgi:hypothetical protein